MFRRPGPDDAIDAARQLLDGGERVDMLAVARLLGVSRATVHRWFGTRDQLLAALFERLAVEFVAEAEAQLAPQAHGDERVFEFVRAIAENSAGYEPLRVAAAREPAVVLRLMLAEDGAVYAQVADAVRRLLAPGRSASDMRRLEKPIETFVAASIALHWATIAAGARPEPSRYELLGRALLA